MSAVLLLAGLASAQSLRPSLALPFEPLPLYFPAQGLEAAPALPDPPEALPTKGTELQEFIWTQRVLPGAYEALPTATGGLKDKLRTLLSVGRTFDHDGEELPPSHRGFKLLHPFGSVVKVRYRSLAGHDYTGVFADAEVPGLMRLSLARPQDSGTFIPGAALKLFIDGRPSANTVMLGERTGVDGQQPDRDFFAQPFTNLLPPASSFANKVAGFLLGLFNRGNAMRLPVDHFALRSADGTAAPSPRAPYRLLLKAADGLSTLSVADEDFRTALAAAVRPGPLFEVFAQEAPGAPLELIGAIEALSGAVASEYGDKGLFFRHRRGRP